MERAARASGVVLALLLVAACGERRHAGSAEGARLPESVVSARGQRQVAPARALGLVDAKQILFGDIHVHTTFSADAFEASLPILLGEGAHPPADACDFARHCAELDFWASTEHAEFLDPRRWQEVQESVRTCDALAGDPSAPDMVSFLGWEWTQIGATPELHYGHKNVLLREIEPDRVPARPIAYDAPMEQRFTVGMDPAGTFVELLKRPWLDFANRDEYWDHIRYTIDTFRVPICPPDVPFDDLPADCRETATTPDVLFRKLREWGGASMVIPHGNTWGLYTPPGASWNKQLAGAMHDAERQTLIEVYSGHGNSEEYRDWRAVSWDEAGDAVCPAPSDDYLPCCWRAGELIRDRCTDPGSALCEERVRAARDDYLAAGASGHLTLPGVEVEDWLDCGQCRDCFMPAFNYRPGASVQAAMATTRGEGAGRRRFRFGFLASSDNHTARPGTGYKEYARTKMADVSGAVDAVWAERLLQPWGDPSSTETRSPDEIEVSSPHAFFEAERRTSFLATGGLVAVHAAGRSRDAIWAALERKEVYGTSGPRILLWLHLLNGPAGVAPMGVETALSEPPRFEVRAVGAFVQKPGCPRRPGGLSPERIERLCRGECYHPGDARHPIDRIEVVRILPASRDGEDLAALIDDPWLVLDCPDQGAGCRVEFEDAEFVERGRDALYYVRAIQAPTQAVNGAGLRCEAGPDGACVATRPCYGDYRTAEDDDCLAPVEERAWSSPIFVDVASSTN